MARPIWKGHISFGLVSIPIQLFSAQESDELQFNLLDKRNKARIRYERINAKTGKEVPWEEIVKGYQLPDGRYVIVEEADLKGGFGRTISDH